jgi:hypothetical protein
MIGILLSKTNLSCFGALLPHKIKLSNLPLQGVSIIPPATTLESKLHLQIKLDKKNLPLPQVLNTQVKQ